MRRTHFAGSADQNFFAVDRDLNGPFFVRPQDARTQPLVPVQDLLIRDSVEISSACRDDNDFRLDFIQERFRT